MLADDARVIAATIEERVNAGAAAGQEVTVTVKADAMSPKSVPAGAGRPTFVRYYICIADDTRTATLELGQAGRLVDEVELDWDRDRLFEAIHARNVPIEKVSAETSPEETT